MEEVRSAARVLDLLEHLQAQDRPHSLSAIAAALMLPKSSTLLLLRTLVGRGYALRTADDGYEATVRFDRHARLLAAALPVMQEVCGDTRETVLLGVLAPGGQIRALAKEVSPQDLRYDADLTPLRPGHCTAMGRVLLAALPPDRRDLAIAQRPLARYTPSTVVDPDVLRGILAEVAGQGYACVSEEYAIGGSGVAAPIHDAEGRVIAALDIASVTARFALVRDQLIRSAIAAGAAISRRLR